MSDVEVADDEYLPSREAARKTDDFNSLYL